MWYSFFASTSSPEAMFLLDRWLRRRKSSKIWFVANEADAHIPVFLRDAIR
jgi:hypothetical protein